MRATGFTAWLGTALFDALAWLVLIPCTLWETVRHPLKMITAGEGQARTGEDPAVGGYQHAPSFMLVSLVLLQMLLHSTATFGVENGNAFKSGATQAVLWLSFNPICLATLVPLVAALGCSRQGLRLDRSNLRRLFFGQCYPVPALAVGLALAASVAQSQTAGASIVASATLSVTLGYYAITQIAWLRRRGPEVTRG